MKKLLNGRDMFALLSLFPPVNYCISREDNVVEWIQMLRTMKIIEPDESFPEYNIWPELMKRNFDNIPMIA